MKRSTKIALTSASILASLVSISGCVNDDNKDDFAQVEIMYGPAPAFEFHNGSRVETTQVVPEEITRVVPEETTNNG